MGRFDKHELPFDKYKNYLIDYLHMQGIEVQIGQVTNCPWHNDSTPSFSVFTGEDGTPAFNCFGCGRAGDIYKAVEYCTGETDAKKQFEEIDRIFGAGEAMRLASLPRPAYAEKNGEPAFTPDPAAFARFTDWLKSQPKADEYILGYFAQRAQIKSEGYIHQYPQEILRRLVTYFYWYPGKKAAEEALGKPALFAAGVPYAKKDENLPSEQRKIAWWHSGVLAKSPEGYKLLFMDGIESKKINPRAGVSYFPVPAELPEGKPVVLLEGEIDAILCHASGIENAFSMGGKGGLTKARIQKYIIPKNIPEIILFADNDTDGGSQKKFGLMPVTPEDHIRETVPENLIKMGYTGKIRVTVLPDDCGFKDPDDAIRNGRLDLVQAAIANARDYVAPEKPAKTAKTKKQGQLPVRKDFYSEWDYVPIKFFKSILRIFRFEEMKSEDVQPFLAAASRTCVADGAMEALVSWCNEGFSEENIKKFAEENPSCTPYYLKDTLFPKYNISAYYTHRLEEHLVPAKEILNKHKIKASIIPVKYDELIECGELQSFLDKKGNFTGSELLIKAFEGNVIYWYEEKMNYAYDNGRWFAVPQLEFVAAAHDTLQGILLSYLAKYPNQKEIVSKALETINTRRFRVELLNDFNGSPQILRGKIVDQDVEFDSAAKLMATVTLADGVLDFSRGELKFRKGKREEYRLTYLPYTVKDVKAAAEPKKFLRLMHSNFRKADEETLRSNPTTTVETLMYYLSLIQARDTTRRYGGFFLGAGGTGKTTMLKILDALYPNLTTPLNYRLLVHRRSDSNENPNGPTPEKAKLEGKLLGYISETPENGRLDENEFKSLTGGDKMTARLLHKDPHDFVPSAQIIIASNNSPAFSSTETATIDRMMIFRFNVRHEKGQKDSMSQDEIIKYLAPEFPAIVKYFAEKYIDLNVNKKGMIPLSTECITEKGMYIDEQANDTDRFIAQCIWFDTNSQKAFITCKELYRCYISMLEVTYNKKFPPESKETPSQRQFTTWLKKHVEFQHTYGQERVPGSVFPEYGFHHVAFTEYGLQLLSHEAGSGFLPPTSPAPTTTNGITAPPDDDPFAAPLTDADGNEIDIY